MKKFIPQDGLEWAMVVVVLLMLVSLFCATMALIATVWGS